MKTKAVFFFFVSLFIFSCSNPFFPDKHGEKDYSIHFNSNGGLGNMEAITGIKSGESVTLTENTFTRAGYTFTGWAESAEGDVEYMDKEEIIVNANITLYAVWASLPDYNIIIEMIDEKSGDSLIATPSSGKLGDTITLTYILGTDSGKRNNEMEINFTNSDKIIIDTAGEGNIPYTLNVNDLSDGVIRIIAIFTHSDKELQRISFPESRQIKTYGDGKFIYTVDASGAAGSGAISYSSDNTQVAAVNSNTGEVTILKAGTSVITAVKAADEEYEEAKAVYTLEVEPRQLIISDPTVTTNKPYDGNMNAAVIIGTLQNVINGDTVNVQGSATYNSYEAAHADLITVVYTISGADASNYIKPVNYTIAGTITPGAKQTGANLGSAPSLASRTQNSITVYPVSAPSNGQTVEYAIGTGTSAPASGWQDGTTFGGLAQNTAYYVFARSKENATHFAGTAISAQFSTLDPSDISRSTIVDFEADAIGTSYQYAYGDNSPTSVSVVSDPVNSGQKSLQINNTGYNQAAIIPINLPYALQNYKTFSFRFYLSSGTVDNEIYVYAAGNTSTFVRYAFGNSSSSGYSNFEENLLGKVTYDGATGSWKTYTITINNPGAAIKDLQGNIYLAIGINQSGSLTYLIDDLTFTMKDDFVPSPVETLRPPAPTPASVGAAITGNYRNLFSEFGKSDAEINAKVQGAWDDLFYGTETTKIYYTVGSDMAYIYTADTYDVRSEGMSYGMMICLQLDKKEEFDRLWKWARTYMYYPSNVANGSNRRGFFNWQCRTDGTHIDQGIAPDGEMYFVTSLLFASTRWGDGDGIYNYGKEARQILYDMIHRDPGGLDNYGAEGMFRSNNYMPVFSTLGNSQNHTDPSYHLPSFYEIWAIEVEQGSKYWNDIWGSEAAAKTDAEFWRKATEASRKFFPTTVNAQTGLGPDYANFDGSPTGGNHADFRFDAWRIAMNIAMDYAWWAADSWQIEFADRIQAFFYSKGVSSYGNQWTLSGTQLGADHSPGLVACNAVASLAATKDITWDFLEDFWNIRRTTGDFRYYDGCLYMMGLLHVTGNYKAYYSGTSTANPDPGVSNSSISPTSATFDKREDLQSDITVTMTLNGNTLVSIQNGSSPLASGTDYTVSGNVVTLKKEYLVNQSNGTTTLTFTFSAGSTRNIAITIRESADPGPMLLEYDFSTASSVPDGITATGDVTLSIVNGALQYARTSGNYQTNPITIPFDLGDTYLTDYASVTITLVSVTGDTGNKTFNVRYGGSSGTVIATQNNIPISAAGSTTTMNFNASVPSSTTGSINLSFEFNNTNPLTFQIRSITLNPK